MSSFPVSLVETGRQVLSAIGNPSILVILVYKTGETVLKFPDFWWHYFIRNSEVSLLMFRLLLAIIYISFISLGLPDSLLGSAWPSMYPQFGVPVS